MLLGCSHPKLNHDNNIIEALMMVLIAIRDNSITFKYIISTTLPTYVVAWIGLQIIHFNLRKMA